MQSRRFLVELVAHGDGWGSVPEVVAGARSRAEASRAAGVPVRLLRSLYVPEDDAWFLLVEAPSAGTAARLVDPARAGVGGIVAAVRVEGNREAGGADLRSPAPLPVSGWRRRPRAPRR